jgi:hypothetical protein
MFIQDQRPEDAADAPLPARTDSSRQCPYCAAPPGPDSTELSLAAAELGLLTHFVGLSERISGRQS